VVTLAVLPNDAERIALAATEGKISLALRNPLDVAPTQTPGIRLTALMQGQTASPEAVPAVNKPRAVARRPAPVVAAPQPAPPPVPSVYTVETFRAAKRGEEVVR
jgi:pilus assembly protein CpaB